MMKTPSGNEAIIRGKMNQRFNRYLLAALFVFGTLGLSSKIHAAESKALATETESKELGIHWDLDAFIAKNFTIFKENLPIKRAEKILEFLTKNGLNPQIAIAPEYEGVERKEGEAPTYDILIPISEQGPLENLLVAELDKQKEYQKKRVMDITPSARCCCQKRHGFILTADFLYWKITEDNLNYGIREPGGTLLFSAAPFAPFVTEVNGLVQYNPIEQPFEWDPGVRIGAGYNLPYYGWDVNLYWTYIQSTPELFMSEPNFGIVTNLLFATPTQTADFQANNLQANWHLVFNALDLLAGRHLFLSRKLSIYPFGGLKTAWIDQKISHTYSDFRQVAATLFAVGPIQSKNDFWGIGPEIGFNSRYVLPVNFGIFFEAATALLYGKWELETKYHIHTARGVAVLTSYDIHMRENKHRLAPWLHLQLGLDWQSCFGKNRCIHFKAGYECQFWWNQMRIETAFFTGDPKGHLMMNGLTLEGKFEF